MNRSDNPLIFEALYEELGYSFSDAELLVLALTHCSYDGETGKNNQRLEFLGDAILEFAVSSYLYENHLVDEGVLTKQRANLVREETLFEIAKVWNLKDYLKLGRGEKASGGRDRSSINADALEALFGAVYLDGGMDALNTVMEAYIPLAMEISKKEQTVDYKTRLQQKLGAEPERFVPSYKIIEKSGPAHKRHFVAAVLINEKEQGRGEGASKRLAEQQAAKIALEKIENTGRR